MPGAFGTDVVEDLGDGRWAVDALRPKGWKARRIPTSPTSPVAPGSAVRWEGSYWEVLEAIPRGEGLRYVLAPWDEQHVFRTVEDYDEATERARRAERKAEQKRHERRRWTIVLGLLVGHLPVEVQERLETELGTPATRLTVISVFPPLALGFFCVFAIVVNGFATLHGAGSVFDIPIWLFPVGNYLFAESCLRLAVGMGQGRPIGSLLGLVVWTLATRLRGDGLAPAGRTAATTPRSAAAAFGGGARPPAPPGARGVGSADLAAAAPGPDPEVLLRDALRMREPYLSLLPVEDQLALARRFGWDPVLWGRRVALFVLLVSSLVASVAAGALRSGAGGPADALLLAAALYLTAEQLVRLWWLRLGRPAPSLLGTLVRRGARSLLMATIIPVPRRQRPLVDPK